MSDLKKYELDLDDLNKVTGGVANPPHGTVTFLCYDECTSGKSVKIWETDNNRNIKRQITTGTIDGYDMDSKNPVAKGADGNFYVCDFGCGTIWFSAN